jgi:phosphopantetheinyl transferase
MPLEKIECMHDRAWGLWKITESEEALLNLVNGVERIESQLSHPLKRLEFVTGRVLAKVLLEELGYTFNGVAKDAYGKPFYKSSNVHLSLSHSFPYVAALADTSKSVGIDVEQVKPKLQRVAPRILHPSELLHANNDATKLCVYWCAKETLVKVHGKKDLVFSEDLIIDSFHLEKQGFINGKIIANGNESLIPLWYQVYTDFVIVFNV